MVTLLIQKVMLLNRTCRLVLLLSIPIILYLLPLDGFLNGNSICLVKRLFGVECWGCGITRAVLLTLHNDIDLAVQYNSLVIIVFPLLIVIWIKLIVEEFRRRDM